MASGLLVQAFNDPPFDLPRVPADSTQSNAFSLREFTYFHQVVDVRTLEAGFSLYLVTAHDVTFDL